MRRTRLRHTGVDEIARTHLLGTTRSIEEGLTAAGLDPATVLLEPVRYRIKHTVTICQHCGQWITWHQYYREGCPTCGYGFDRTKCRQCHGWITGRDWVNCCPHCDFVNVSAANEPDPNYQEQRHG